MQVNPYSKLKENVVLTAPKDELTLMLYDGAVRFANQALVAVKEKDVSKAHNFLIRAQDIIREFQLTLDRKYEVAQDFDVMYGYIHNRLIEANISKDPEVIQECTELIRNMRDIWKEAMALARGAGSGAATNVNARVGGK